MVVASRIRARSLMCARRRLSGQPTRATVSNINAMPVLNQLAPWMYGNTEDQKVGSSDRIQSIAAKLLENARTIRPIPLIQESADGIGCLPPRGPHSANAASKFHSTT